MNNKPMNQPVKSQKPLLRLLTPIGVMAAMFGLSACNGATPMLVMQITVTPNPRVIEITVTDTPAQAIAAVGSPTTIPATAAPVSVQPTTVPATSAPAATVATVSPASPIPATGAQPVAASPIPPTTGAVPGVTATPAPAGTSAAPAAPTANPAIPTETHSQLIIAHENFEHGYMFWISVYKQDWVLLPPASTTGTPTAGVPTNGVWMIFPDTFVDGEPETDPALIPPSALLFQPRRGFGKLWRTNTQVKDALGWATTQEFGLTTSYVYQPGGYIDATSHQWVPGPGTHFLVTVSRETFAFHEPAPGQQFGTWEKVS